MLRRAGFSLIELMTTVLILGLIASFSVPAVVKSLSAWNLHTSRDIVVSEIKLLRQKAITQGRSLRVWFSPLSNQYWFQNPTTGIWTTYQLPNRVTFESVTFVGGPYDTYLEPDGRSRRSGTIVLVNNKGARDTLLVNLSGWVGRP
jgi:prepilin-type N-terminal cleavage/methylation domain-containing protein